MKHTKTLKSLAELSVDSTGKVNTEPEKSTPAEQQVLAKGPQKSPYPDGAEQMSDNQGFRDWGINE